MSKHWFLIAAAVLLASPSALRAVGMEGMEGMGGMGGMVDQVHLQTKSVGKVLFSHSAHGTNCGACHPKLFEKKRSTTPVSMKAMERGKSCGACHDGKKAFSVTGSCTKCHAGDILYKIKDPGDAVFSHGKHAEMATCEECHPKVFKAQRGANRATMEEMEKGKSCGACHDGSNAFNVSGDCEKCHKM